MPSRQHPRKKKPVATKWHHGHPRSTGESTVEDRYLTVVAQPQSEDVEGISPHVLEERIPQELHAERTGSQQTEETSSQEETETLNVLVNDGSSVGAYTLDLIVPPNLISKITQFPTLETKRFLRDLCSGKVKHICILVTEDEYVTDIRSAAVLAENEWVLSSLSMDESVLDEKTRIERYMSQSWESLQAILCIRI